LSVLFLLSDVRVDRFCEAIERELETFAIVIEPSSATARKLP